MAVTVTCDLDVSEMGGSEDELADARLMGKTARVCHERIPCQLEAAGAAVRGH